MSKREKRIDGHVNMKKLGRGEDINEDGFKWFWVDLGAAMHGVRDGLWVGVMSDW